MNPADPKISLIVNKMRKVYNIGCGKNKVGVKNVSFSVEKGKCFALLGVNGAGKTSLFQMITGDLNSTEG